MKLRVAGLGGVAAAAGLATAAVLDDGKTRAAMVVCDLIGLPRAVVVEARRLVAEKTGIPASTVVSRLKAGEPLQSIASDYGITLEQVTDAIRCALPAAA